jgi:polysaccharide deacetylase 2 family uncharacterized protein YibQ
MDRREFLRRNISFVAGSFLSLGGFSKAFAFGGCDRSSFSPPRIALIIDDIGFSSFRARKFLDLKIPITFSVLPRLKKSFDLAVEIHEKGHEIMLHQPMEPSNPELDPGPGALYLGFSAAKIARVIDENFGSVPFATGVNNHMGSKYTESQNEVNEVMKVINRGGLFFVDSLTTSHSKAYETARRMHLPSACRNRFLDNNLEESAIHFQLRRLMGCALRYGHAIGIGHPYPKTAEALDRFSDEFDQYGISLVHVSQVLPPQSPQQISP